MQKNITLKLFGALILGLSTGKNLVAADRSPFAGFFGRAIGNVATVGAATGGAHFLLKQHGSGMREVGQEMLNNAARAGIQEARMELAKPENQRAIAGAAQGVANRAVDHLGNRITGKTFVSFGLAAAGTKATVDAVHYAVEENNPRKAAKSGAIAAGLYGASVCISQ